MKFNCELDLDDMELWDGQSIASGIADELTRQITNKVRKAVKEDPRVDELVKKMKEAAINQMLDSLGE